jgi:pyruvate/2-oxoglutarate/acetoin dehydrogenase E1 component
LKKEKFITYSEAINEGTRQAMEISKQVIILGQLIDSKAGVFGSTKNLVNIFGKIRVRDFPVSESLMTAVALGAAITGKRVVIVHIRIDFMYYSMDTIVNWLSLWRFKSNGKSSLSVVIRAIVGKGWGQGPQHSKSTHSWFSNLPGLRVGMPTNAFDAKGMLLDSIFSNNPTILIEHRSFFDLKEYVPIKPYRIEFGKCSVRKRGKDITLVAIGYGIIDSLKAAEILIKKFKIDVEVIDIKSLYPLDIKGIITSVKKTKRLIVVDPSWRSFGASSEIISLVSEKIGKILKNQPQRVTYPNSHTPASSYLEKKFYFNYKKIISAINKQFQ